MQIFTDLLVLGITAFPNVLSFFPELIFDHENP